MSSGESAVCELTTGATVITERLFIGTFASDFRTFFNNPWESLRVPAVHIRAATPDEAAALTKIAHAAKSHWGYPETWIARWRSDLTFTADYIHSHPTFVACEADAVLGVCALEIEGSIAHIEHLWVLPSAMHRGVGRVLFTHAETVARAAGVRTLHIVSDPHAEGFYRKVGAHVHERRPAPMDGHERHLVRLRKSLDGEAKS
jgi:N-acetylglutamate synthase-like GNAT family acetyltransferase